MGKNFFVKTYGCASNEYDSEKLIAQMEASGHKSVVSMEEADVVILNTCNIRQKAVDKVSSEIGRIALKQSPTGGKIDVVVAGCAAQAEGSLMFARNPNVVSISGPGSLDKIPEQLELYWKTGEKQIALNFDRTKYKSSQISSSQIVQQKKISSLLVVQEGCDNFCTFCCVPYTRGPEHSRPVREVVEEAKILAKNGTLELCLLGQTVNKYRGIDENGKERSLGYLAKQLSQIEGIHRIWYTSSHPSGFCDELLQSHIELPQLLPYIHLAVQSGSNKILSAMNRKHTAEQFLSITEKVRIANPDIHFATDIIVGFPGETREDFQMTIDLLRASRCLQVFAFAYSVREGTPAADMLNQIPQEEKMSRLMELQQIILEERAKLLQSMISKEPQSVMLTGTVDKKTGYLAGRSRHMVPVFIEGLQCDPKIVDVEITRSTRVSLGGIMINS